MEGAHASSPLVRVSSSFVHAQSFGALCAVLGGSRWNRLVSSGTASCGACGPFCDALARAPAVSGARAPPAL
eukprot:7383140-Prymnesium_polylepis.1